MYGIKRIHRKNNCVKITKWLLYLKKPTALYITKLQISVNAMRNCVSIIQHVVVSIKRTGTHSTHLHIAVGIMIRCGGPCLERPGTDADVCWLAVVRQRRLHHGVHLLFSNMALSIQVQRSPADIRSDKNLTCKLAVRAVFSFNAGVSNHATKHALINIATISLQLCDGERTFGNFLAFRVTHYRGHEYCSSVEVQFFTIAAF